MVFRTGGGTFTAPVTFTLSMTIGTTMAAPFVITGAMTYYPVWELYVTPAGTSFIGTALLLAGYPTLTLPPIIATLPPPFPPFLDLEDLIMGYIAANGDPWDMYNLPGRRAAVGPAQDTAIFQYNSFWLND